MTERRLRDVRLEYRLVDQADLDQRAARLANIVGLRPTGLSREPAGALPIASGPVT